jgi:hypothetical protein
LAVLTNRGIQLSILLVLGSRLRLEKGGRFETIPKQSSTLAPGLLVVARYTLLEVKW